MILSFFSTYFLVNGVWGQWSSFTECSWMCGGATKTRRRACDSPASSDGGDPCPGNAVEEQPCNTFPCPGMYNQSLVFDLRIKILFFNLHDVMNTVDGDKIS